ncbi:MAG TPA: M1 family aminopeptidase [Chloroflexia bacterium]|nr:M1 family aminopeptidase [Chloroflexia bacterium]
MNPHARNISRRATFLCVAGLALGAIANVTPAKAAPLRAPSEGFADAAIHARWTADEGCTTCGDHVWMWGPGAFYTEYEPYSDTPQGNHLVQYFDKGRLEVNDPQGDKNSPWYVTSGLLVKEMVAGATETGGGHVYEIGPANVAVAGDGNGGPTYADFAGLTGHAGNQEGQPLGDMSLLRVDGATAEVVPEENPPASITIGRYEEASGHNWADVFWSFAQTTADSDTTTQNSERGTQNSHWLPTLGYPITEPYWITVPINGKASTVLVQLFERRTLTYNPGNPAATRVEMGNVGRHYWQWRYADRHEANMDAQYSASITVGEAPDREVHLEETVSLSNGSDSELGALILRAPWKHWDGVLTIESVQVNGQAAETRWLEDINLEVALPQAVPPGGEVTVELEADLAPRPVGGRTGYDVDNDILTLGDMLPTLVPYENGGWQYYPYSELGDLGNNASAHYSIVVKSSGGEKLVVGGTGDAVERSSDGTYWRFEADNVRDVAYVVSPRFINPYDDASMTRQVGDVTMLAFYLRGHKEAGQRQLDLTAPALGWFGEKIGAYPFDTYTIAEMGVPLEKTDNYAQEYPMAYFIPSQWLAYGTAFGTWTWYTPVHEVGHQWFYSTVGNNQLTDPWLDEAMTTFMTTEYIRANFASTYSQAFAGMTSGATASRPVSAGVYSGFASESQYTAAVYDSGTVMLGKVRKAMGDHAFYAALRDYYTTYRFKRATPEGLLTILQAHSQADLKSIFAAYLAY